MGVSKWFIYRVVACRSPMKLEGSFEQEPGLISCDFTFEEHLLSSFLYLLLLFFFTLIISWLNYFFGLYSFTHFGHYSFKICTWVHTVCKISNLVLVIKLLSMFCYIILTWPIMYDPGTLNMHDLGKLIQILNIRCTTCHICEIISLLHLLCFFFGWQKYAYFRN